MSSTKLLLVGLVLCALLFFGLLVKDTLLSPPAHDLVASKLPRKDSSTSTTASPRLLHLVSVQNRTIHELEQQISELSRQLMQSSSSPIASTGPTASLVQGSNPPPLSALAQAIAHIDSSKTEQDCAKRYGLDLLVDWQSHAETWCKGPEAQLVCYPYHQKHKKLDGRPPDLFCEATNFVIDFNKVSGQASAHKPPLGSQYHGFQMGSLRASCSKTPQYKPNLFMPHQSLQFHTFQPNSPLEYDMKEEKATYLLARDEDCENTFHSTADFMSMFIVARMLQQDIHTQQVMLFDLHPNGPYMDLIHKAFSPSEMPFRFYDKYRGKAVLFKKLVWHLGEYARYMCVWR
ncbi:hypothetical protein EON65_13285 [archaeon]|nr:MAG: hypothetical protein EON65_13285 [archaeon]